MGRMVPNGQPRNTQMLVMFFNVNKTEHPPHLKWIHVRIVVYFRLHMCENVLHVPFDIYICVCVYVYIYMYMCIYIYIYVYVYIYICICVYIYISGVYIYIYIYI